MILITGAAGFIGSCLVQKLNEEGFRDLVLVDDFSRPGQNRNVEGKAYREKVERADFPEWLRNNQLHVQFVFHLGARTDTTEPDRSLLDRLNLEYSKTIWQICVEFGLPLVYASSAATYGLGELGYDDDERLIRQLKPVNPYGESKNDFDTWALEQTRKPFFWTGLKFFHVYGPNEYHKGRMASIVFHTFNTIRNAGKIELFKSHRPDVNDGEQAHDFVYVKDVVDVLYFLMHHRRDSGIYNVGSGQARMFFDLARLTFKALDLEPKISFIPLPEDIRDKYPYFTEAKMEKLARIGYSKPFRSLEEGIEEYIGKYLKAEGCY